MPLNNVVKKLEKNRGKLQLPDDEQIVAGCVANPRGTVAAAAIGGIVGMAVKERMAKKAPTPEGLAAQYPQGRNILGLTSGRLVVCKMSAMTGGPTEVLASFPRSEVASIEMHKGKTSWPMTIRFADGSAVEAEGAKGSGVEDFAVAVGASVG